MVAVGFTADGVDREPACGTRALVVAVVHAVAIAVGVAALSVHRLVVGGVRALVGTVGHPIAVAVAFPVADGEREVVDVAGEEGQRVAALDPFAVTVAGIVDHLEMCRQDPCIVEAGEAARLVPQAEMSIVADPAVPAAERERTVVLAREFRGVEASGIHDREIALREDQHVAIRAAVVPAKCIGIDVAETVEAQRLVDVQAVFPGVRTQCALDQVVLAVILQEDQKLADAVGIGRRHRRQQQEGVDGQQTALRAVHVVLRHGARVAAIVSGGARHVPQQNRIR